MLVLECFMKSLEIFIQPVKNYIVEFWRLDWYMRLVYVTCTTGVVRYLMQDISVPFGLEVYRVIRSFYNNQAFLIKKLHRKGQRRWSFNKGKLRDVEDMEYHPLLFQDDFAIKFFWVVVFGGLFYYLFFLYKPSAMLRACIKKRGNKIKFGGYLRWAETEPPKISSVAWEYDKRSIAFVVRIFRGLALVIEEFLYRASRLLKGKRLVVAEEQLKESLLAVEEATGMSYQQYEQKQFSEYSKGAQILPEVGVRKLARQVVGIRQLFDVGKSYYFPNRIFLGRVKEMVDFYFRPSLQKDYSLQNVSIKEYLQYNYSTTYFYKGRFRWVNGKPVWVQFVGQGGYFRHAQVQERKYQEYFLRKTRRFGVFLKKQGEYLQFWKSGRFFR
jgi:hypothetical protein